jgi:hypothetical protein
LNIAPDGHDEAHLRLWSFRVANAVRRSIMRAALHGDVGMCANVGFSIL